MPGDGCLLLSVKSGLTIDLVCGPNDYLGVYSLVTKL